MRHQFPTECIQHSSSLANTEMTAHRNIYRSKPLPQSGAGAWNVQVRHKGVISSKRFPFQNHGDEDRALHAAILHRDSLMRKLGILDRLTKPYGQHPGVSRTSSSRTDGGRERHDAHWQAYWVGVHGKQVTQRYPVKELGEERAKQAAFAERDRAFKALERGEDPFFEPPKSPKAKLWRYMDFAKFLSLLEDASLFFSSSTGFDDPYEGAASKGNDSMRGFVLSKAPHRRPGEDSIDLNKVMISCWYTSQHESAAMWSLYSKSSDAIAICTTFSTFRKLLPASAKVSLVKYVDYSRDWIPEEDPLYRFMHKRISFEHEHELRAILDLNTMDLGSLGSKTEHGLKLKIPLNKLIDKIYVSPRSATWFLELVERICTRYEIACTPTRSSLYDGPLL